MKMKCSNSFIVTVAVLLLVAGRLWYMWNKEAHAYVKEIAPEQRGGEFYTRPVKTNSPAPAPRPGSNQAPHNLGSN